MMSRWAHIISEKLLVLVLLILSTMPLIAQQQTVTPLRVEAATTGQITSENLTALYSFNAVESTRMGFVFDIIEGDMNPTLIVFDQDQTTVLAGSTGTGNNGVIVKFPTTGTYYVALASQDGLGTSASFRLMIDADPQLPTDAFVLQSFMMSGSENDCASNTPAITLTASEDLNICFTLALVTQTTDLVVQWWSPSGTIVVEESATLDETNNQTAYLSGVVFNGQPFETGWWQVHFLLNGELSYIQWVPVNG